MRVPLVLARGRVLATATQQQRSLSLGVFNPKLVEKREDEMGRGGRMSESGVKVALFGAGGVLGTFVSAELGACGIIRRSLL
jgi:hypothetical protein